MLKNFQDKNLKCDDCGCTFVFNAEDQEFFAQKGYSEPKRCSDCRAARKNSRDSGRRHSGGGGHNKPQYKVICSGCGCETTVPFQPKGDRPVYCSTCYKNSY